jgi:multiple sugar transport system permease protein
MYTEKIMKISRISGRVITKFIKGMVLACLAYQLLFPLLYMISASIRQPIDAFDPSIVWIPKHFSLSSFLEAIKAMKYWQAVQTSFFIGAGCALLDTAIAALTAYGFARFNFPLRNLLFALAIFTIIVPTQTIILPLYLQMKYFDPLGICTLLGFEKINLIGTPLPFFITSALGMGIRSGLYIFIFRQFFAAMPDALEEAAYIDGCGPLMTFLRIMLPNAKNSIITVFLFSFVWHWNEYYLSNLFLGNKQRTITVALSSLRVDLASFIGGQTISDPIGIMTRMQAGVLLTIIPLFLLYLLLQNYFTNSIENIGIK